MFKYIQRYEGIDYCHTGFKVLAESLVKALGAKIWDFN